MRKFRQSSSQKAHRVLNIEVNANNGTENFHSALTSELDLLTPVTPPLKTTQPSKEE